MASPKIVVLSTGSELTAGRSQDTNSSWIANELFGMGFAVSKFVVLPDDPVVISEELRTLTALATKETSILLVMTGGLGPTEDDYTLEVVCKIKGVTAEESPIAKRKMETFYRLRGRNFQEAMQTAVRQVSVPEGSFVLNNNVGIAPGFILSLAENVHLGCMPGVPGEMTEMFREEFAPWILKTYSPRELYSGFRFVWWMSESQFQKEFISKEKAIADGKVIWGVAAKRGYIRVSFQSDNRTLIDDLLRKLDTFYGAKSTSDVFEELPKMLIEKKITVGTAESCTGGLIAKTFTDVPGASAYFYGGIVSYDNGVKTGILGVKRNTLEEFGAVSGETAKEMAEGALDALGVDYSISVTGIAGPGGGTPQKKVGLVYFGIGRKGGETEVHEHYFPFPRSSFREFAAHTGIYLLYKRLKRSV
ncbi:nicotinamide-nucleotide amidohydrolase family protein [Leptospira santarosai]|uniref:nicotinamide-nucleotide amidohydrolase family protein n=1 Tax=Leptospira santarosai TaxID=28183 RepID=UPI0002BE1C7D|nr:nicotinamide-nucleotide amidohydrolase family protein [Leptospira santarosai]ASV10763.1 damage-inducible protein CinA [Leptospira santarosai]EMJ49951.1 competence/damage-inducible protein CinA [Leptospira santarosai str. HAI1349]EMO15582.1 competence/damage-inducible protein CinA [Leptospira santarosai str. CBC523]EMO24251.1 competence/damage-inducible protein CinA [Leptospira santarosai str. HAI134]EMP04135.1 competence/damage-inducible protein CinA [Leptospira santarosai str. HAI1380]